CISHFKAIGRKEWEYAGKAIEMMKNASEDGIRISFDVFPYLRTGSHLYQLLPRWAREGGFSKIFDNIKNPEKREKIHTDLKRYTLHYDRIIVASAKNPVFVGKSLLQTAISTGLTPEETLTELLLINEGRVAIFNKNISSKNLLRLILAKNSMIATDGAGYSLDHQKTGNLVHPRSFGTFIHFLHHFVREHGRLKWEDAIVKITSMPAVTLGIKDRGLLKKTYFADVVVFDPAKLQDTSTYKSPYSYSSGIESVLVNGKIAVSNGELTSVRAGKILKK
ncbi:MAG: amidohydrolase family protein, partial [Candidatus Sungbacteria bacterium]|nr:amidohydrolase family protein [Candidatus Sungbacteria bacterium]